MARLDLEHRQEETRRERKFADQRPGRALICLLKSVAKADRKLDLSEERAIVAALLELFPECWDDTGIRKALNSLDATDMPGAYVRDLPIEFHVRAILLIEQLAMVDGRATPAEKRKLDEIRAAFAAVRSPNS